MVSQKLIQKKFKEQSTDESFKDDIEKQISKQQEEYLIREENKKKYGSGKLNH